VIGEQLQIMPLAPYAPDFPSTAKAPYDARGIGPTVRGWATGMSLVIAIKVDAGAVMASDSRVSNDLQLYSDKSQKIFKLTDRIGIAHAIVLNASMGKKQ